jgi:hypothetical protein
MNAFGKRRDIAEKIRSGHTAIPVRSPQITARKPARPAVEINPSEPSQPTESKDAASKDAAAEEGAQRAMS